MENQYPSGHVIRIKAIDGLIFAIGVAIFATPFAGHFFPGDIDTTSHVALGALVAVLAIFRVLLAYGSLWIEVVLFFLGLIILRLPVIMVQQWNDRYNTGHLAAGGAIMALSVISALLTIPVLNKKKS